MNLPVIFFLLLFSPILGIRWLRWLAIVQQKEYRIDRVWSFLRSSEGKNDLFRLLPEKREFTRTGMKRPVQTLRVSFIALTSLFLMYFLILFIASITLFDYPTVTSFLIFVLFTLVLYLLIPFILLISCVPSAVISYLNTLWVLKQAQAKIRNGKPIIIGVGGSYGKTSTKHLVAQILKQKFSVFVTPKSHNTKYSVAKSITQFYTNQEIALLEYGAYTRGEIHYLTQWFPPQMAIETGFTQQHYSLFGSEANSLHAESELIAALPEKGKVFCNGEDPGAEKICELGATGKSLDIKMYSGENAVVHLSDVQVDVQGQLSFMWKGKRVHTQLVGSHYLPNIQGAIAVAEELGVSESQIRDALCSFVPDTSFIRSYHSRSEALIIDDGGTSNPKGFEAAVALAKTLHRAEKILITAGIVDLGEQSHVIHQHLAQQAHKVFQIVFYCGVDGKLEFETEFGMKAICEKSIIAHTLSKLNDKALVVVEGRVPKWIMSFLEQADE